MNADEIMSKFDALYAKMAASTNIEDMKIFGKACRKAVNMLATHMPTMAVEIIDELCAMTWCNYLTDREAEEIVKNMEPGPRWSKEQVARGLERLGLPMEEAPCFNRNAMYVAISMKYSDSAETIAEKIMGKSLADVDDLTMLKACYHLAHDVLTDKDGVFRVRRYFDV